MTEMIDHGDSPADALHSDLFKAYRETCFVIDGPGREIQLRIGQQNSDADDLLKEHGATEAAFITAWNPGPIRFSKEENDKRQESMEKEIQSAGFRFLRGRGIGTDPSWIPEESVFVFGIPKEHALALSGQFGQLAIVWHEVDKESILLLVPG
jgi:hypothetical protein